MNENDLNAVLKEGEGNKQYPIDIEFDLHCTVYYWVVFLAVFNSCNFSLLLNLIL